ncbi:Ig-like domain-containing protein [Methanobrevibacter sp. V74]|uniref:Ig-like domain-containing protein n=1 Tax=Methanobrevibacter sp. V74 TaxID=3064279 RepID=UPI002734AD95|nr:Ig-like domain-containing protein [Methanobrevibacter sp. V74]
MKLKNIFFISIFLIIIISLTSVVYATDNHTTNNCVCINPKIEINEYYNEITLIEKNQENIKNKNLDNIVTNQTFHDYFDEKGLLKEDVASGATLDFQGKFIANENESFIINITKPINIISTTHDAYIDMNTTAGNYFGEYVGNSFAIHNGGSGTNVSGIKFHNTQLWLANTNYVTLNNISVIVENQRVGSGVGVIAIRENSTYITVRNSYFSTQNNGGSSSLVLSWANYCTIDNNTIRGIGFAGNILYLNHYNVFIPEGIKFNIYNNITNNRIYGTDPPSGICIPLKVFGWYNLIENNTVDYIGDSGINSGISGIVRNNILTRSASICIDENSTGYNNKIIGGNLIVDKTGTAHNNTANKLILQGIAYNNIVNELYVYEGIAYNNTINKNATLSNGTLNKCIIKNNLLLGSMNLVKNSTIKGNITINEELGNNNLISNIIFGSITLYSSSKNSIINNNITTTQNYTIILLRNSKNNIIRDNLLISANSNSDASVSFSDNSNIVTHNYPIGNNSLIVLNTTLTGTNIGMYYNDIQQYQVKLTDSNNKPLPNETIKIKFNGKTTTLQTNENGVVVINIELKKIGTHEIIAKYEGTIKHNKSTTTNKIQIINPFTKNINMSMYYQEKINYKIQIIGKNNKPIKADERIIFKINKKTIKTKTNKNGYATIKLTLKPGKYTITTIYKNYKTINQIKIKPTLITKNIIKKKTKTIKFTAKLINTKGKPQTNKKIKFKIKRKTYTAKTNKKGYATVKITNLKTGKHKITTTYQKQKTTNKITIKK